MKFNVSSDCVGCGYCASVCPVFTMSKKTGRAVAQEGEVSGDLAASAAETETLCPAQAISHEE